ncbi:MAG: DUF1573 domain-containing protein [Bacteroidota bacterium]
MLYIVDLDDSGNLGPDGVKVLASGLSGTPLDVTSQVDGEIFAGTIWSALYDGDKISVLEPADMTICSGSDSETDDDDGDQYSNADEIAAGSDPCNPAQVPSDADLDYISDVNDDDDDNDGILDTEDVFPLDPDNGLMAELPINYELLNGDPGFGFFGLGFTGIMHDGTNDYLKLYEDEDNSYTEIIAGGAVGLLTYNPVPSGSAKGGTNNAKNAFQFGVNTALDKTFTVTADILDPVLDSSSGMTGLFFGDGTQSNYFAFGLGQGGVIHYQEQDDSSITEDTFSLDNYPNLSEIQLNLTVDPAVGTVTPFVSFPDGESLFTSEPISLGETLKLVLGDQSKALAVGLIADNPSTEDFSATWDSLNINYDDGSTTSPAEPVESPGEPVAGAKLVVTSNTHIVAVESGTEDTITIKLKNEGTAEIIIEDVILNGSAFELGAIPSTIASGKSESVEVNFIPGAGGNDVFQGTVTIVSNDPVNPEINIMVTGERAASSEELLRTENTPIVGDKIFLKGVAYKSQNYYYLAKNVGDHYLKFDEQVIQDASEFEIVAGNTDGTIALKSKGLFVSSENGNDLMSIDRTEVGPWESFTVIDEGDGFISIMGNNGKYISSNSGEDITCDSTSIDIFTKFTWHFSGSTDIDANTN